MSVRWETEGLQTVGIVCLVIMFLKLMHLLGLIDITETGEMIWDRCCNGGGGGKKDERRHGATFLGFLFFALFVQLSWVFCQEGSEVYSLDYCSFYKGPTVFDMI